MCSGTIQTNKTMAALHPQKNRKRWTILQLKMIFKSKIKWKLLTFKRLNCKTMRIRKREMVALSIQRNLGHKKKYKWETSKALSASVSSALPSEGSSLFVVE